MKSIRKKMYHYIVACILGTAASFLLWFSIYGSGQTELPLFLPLSATALAAALALREGRMLSAARLIVDNQLLHIESAAVLTQNTGKPDQNVEVFVSCFGLLLGSKIVKFNQEGILLKSVEIGRDYLSLDYGTDKRTQSVRLTHTGDVNDRLEDIIESFRYETGIVPTISIEKE